MKKAAGKKKRVTKKAARKGEVVTGFRVAKAMIFNGVHFQPGDVFEPESAGCTAHRLNALHSARKLSSEIITAERGYDAIGRTRIADEVEGEEVKVETDEVEVEGDGEVV